MTQTNQPKKSIAERIGTFLEQTLGEVDPTITLVDQDLSTGDITVLLNTGERLRISIVSEN
jgi:phenylpyruvate tautomerase PptA (4-oxalocrotonate tautomerase family)